MKDDDKLHGKRVQLALEDTDSYSATVAAFPRKVAGLGRRRGFPLAAMSDVRRHRPFAIVKKFSQLAMNDRDDGNSDRKHRRHGRRSGGHHRRGRDHARQHQ